jgi:tRNA modification GTPase
MINERSDTIAAISTALGKSGIGIVRISGNNAITIISSIIKSSINLFDLSYLNSRKLIHGYLLDHNGDKIDEVLVAFMPPAKSFTGEYTVEINCHGGIAAVTSALDLVLKNGARLAEPGEFAKRACQNGRIDLIQAEAINQIIESNSINSLKIAWRQFDGGLSGKCNLLKNETLEVLSRIQYLVDFDENQSNDEITQLFQRVMKIRETIEDMLRCSERTNVMNRATWISIYGPPNAGKSSLFNALLRIPRAIVCDQPGTTRDHISENFLLNGNEIRLTDTAGIRETGDNLEIESIKRSWEQVEAADVIIYVLDGSKEITPEQEIEINKVINKNGLVILNKSDLNKNSGIANKVNKFEGIANVIELSAKTGDKLENLEKAIKGIINFDFDNSNDLVMLTIRQKSLLEGCLECIANILDLKAVTLDIFSFELRTLVENIDKITGTITNEDILNNIFSNFCVGK